MGRTAGNNSAAPRKGGNSMWVGILVGILVGVSMVAGIAWYLMKSPSPFTKKDKPTVAKSQPEPAKTSTPATTDKTPATSSDGKPRFEFYKVLTDKQNAPSAEPVKPSDKSKPVEKTHPADNKIAKYEPQILQAGSFPNASDAEKIKAKLALLGVEANIQSANIPDKGVWYRVRLGPYKSAEEMNQARSFLKQNGVESTPMHAQ